MGVVTIIAFVAGGCVGVVLAAAWCAMTRGRPGPAGLDPLQRDLAQLRDELRAAARDQARSDGAVGEALGHLQGVTASLSDETRTLRSALRDVRVRGSWGELHLRRVVELAGMSEHADFDTQVSAVGPAGPVRPDLVVRLPGRRAVVVDAKVPLDAYLDAAEGSDREAADHRRRHAAAMLGHARALGARRYADAVDGAIDVIVMFVPGEGFLAAACEADPHLIEKALGHGVVPATPTTLVALLRAVAVGWREQKVADNARAIADLGAELHERVCRFAEHLDAVGRSLGTAVEGYNRAVGSFDSRLVPGARRLADAGATHSRSLVSPDPIDLRPRSAG